MTDVASPPDVKKEMSLMLYDNPIHRGRYRNHPCVCGSGKKMKKCHGESQKLRSDEYHEVMRLGREHNQRAEDFKQALIDKSKELENEKVNPGNNETLSDAEILAQECKSGA